MFWRRKKKPASPAEIERAWRRSLRAAIAGDWPGAETWLERIVESDSDDLDAYHALARLYRQQGSIGRSIRMHQNLLLRSDLARDARHEALVELARDFEAGGFKERAAASYEEILVAQPRNDEVLEHLVTLLLELREYPRGLLLARRLRRRNKPVGEALEVRLLLAQAQACCDEGDHDAARHAVKRCLRRDKMNALAWTILGELEAERGKTAKALAAWKRAVNAEPDAAADLYPKIAASYAARDKPEDFDVFLEKQLEERPLDHSARIALARARAARGDTNRAIEDLARAIEVTPDHAGLRIEYGRQLLASGQEAEAQKAYGSLLDAIERGAVAMHPESVD